MTEEGWQILETNSDKGWKKQKQWYMTNTDFDLPENYIITIALTAVFVGILFNTEIRKRNPLLWSVS